MSYWQSSTVSQAGLEKLVQSGHLPERTDAQEWIVPGNETEPQPSAGYVVSFVAFHRHGFALPANKFFRGLLDYYGIALHHLNPNGIQDIATFVAICEGYMRIPPHFDLWRWFFSVALKAPKEVDGVPQGEPYPVGCACIHLRHDRSRDFPRMKLSKSNKGWMRGWFYLRNDANFGLPEYTTRVFKERPMTWHWGPPAADRPKWAFVIDAVVRLKNNGVTGMGATGFYHARGVAPLMQRDLSLDLMTDSIERAGTVLRGGVPSNEVIVAYLKDAFEDPVPGFPIEGHPPMYPDFGAIRIVSVPSL